MAHILGTLAFVAIGTLLVRWMRPALPYIWRSILLVFVGVVCVSAALFLTAFCAMQVMYMRLSLGDMALATMTFAFALVMVGVGVLRTSHRLLLFMELVFPQERQPQIRLYSADDPPQPDESFAPH